MNFKANLIGNTPIKQLYNNKYIDTKANLVELKPNNSTDLAALKEIGDSWYCGSSLAAEIYLDANENNLYKTKNKQKFYSLERSARLAGSFSRLCTHLRSWNTG